MVASGAMEGSCIDVIVTRRLAIAKVRRCSWQMEMTPLSRQASELTCTKSALYDSLAGFHRRKDRMLQKKREYARNLGPHRIQPLKAESMQAEKKKSVQILRVKTAI